MSLRPHVVRSLALCALVAGSAGRSVAQPAPPSPPSPSPAEPAEPEEPARPAPVDDAGAPRPLPPPAEARDDAGWQLYHQAFAALARGDRRGARALVAQLARELPGHPATRAATAGVSLELRRDPLREVPTRNARAELGLFQGLHGIAVGVELCLALECDSPEAYFGLGLLGGISGTAAALSFHPTPGQRALINSGAAWGAFNAAMLLIATDPDDASSYGLTLLGGQAAGVGLAAVLSRDAPAAGQVALANSGGQWTLAVTGLVLATADVDLDGQQIATTLALAADAGIGVGAYLAWRKPRISRAQTLVIDAAGIAGVIAGGATGVLVTGDAESRATTGAAAVGAVVGLGAAAYLTRHWDDDSDGDDGPPITALVRPVPGGGLVSAHLVW